MNNKLLMTPGPTNVPDRVLKKMQESMFHHRTKEFSNVFYEMSNKLKHIFQTENPVLTLTCAGTGGLEASIANMFSKGDKVLIVTIGVFGDRFIKIAKIYGLDVDVLSVPWGKGVTVQEIKDRLLDEHKALIVTHNETSTGAVNPIKEIGEFMKDKEQLFVVDGVSSVGGIEVKMDEWNIDVLITGSQKALMTPPGLCFVGVSDKGWEAYNKSNLPKFYFDFKAAKDSLEKAQPQNPYTPAVTLIAAANEAFNMIQEEGLQNAFKRHERIANDVRNEVERLGLSIYTDKNYLSNNLTAIKFKEENVASSIKKRMEEEFGIVIAGGQQELKDKIIRIGHMGYVTDEMVKETLNALKKCI